jgi:hypothetical protein
MSKFKNTAIALAAGVAVLGLTACDPSQLEPTPTPVPRVVDATETPWVAPTSVLPVKVDPYTTTGTWLVPSEIAPGTYRVNLKGANGYYEVCADLACDIDFDGDDSTGMIDNAFLEGPGFVEIPAHAEAVTLRGVELVAVA